MNELEVVKMILEEKRGVIKEMSRNLEGSEWDKTYGKLETYRDVLGIIDAVQAGFKEESDDLIVDADDDLIDDCFIDSNEVSDLFDELKTTSNFFRTLFKQDPKAFTSTASSHDVNHTDHDEPDDVRA